MSSAVVMLWGPSVPEEMTVCPISAHRSSVCDTVGICVHIKHPPCTYDYNKYRSKKYETVSQTYQFRQCNIIMLYFYHMLHLIAIERVTKEKIRKIIDI